MGRIRGRKSQPAAKRRQTTVEGRGYLVGPTPETLVKKALMLNQPLNNLAAILAMDASRPLAVLVARNIITTDHRDAGDEFAWLYWRNIGKPFARAANMAERVSSGMVQDLYEPDPEADVRWERRFNIQHDELNRLGMREYNAFAGPVVEHEWPSWFFSYIEAKEMTWQFRALLSGLDALVNLRIWK